MLSIIQEAVKNFSIHQLMTTCTEIKTPPQMRTVVAYLDINILNGDTYRVHVAYSYALLQSIAEVYLAEENSDDDVLHDMALETTNMIIGSAKTLASETALHFDIATPHLDTEAQTFDAKESLSMLIKELPITLTIEECI